MGWKPTNRAMSLREIKSLVQAVSGAKPEDGREQIVLLDRINSMRELMAKGQQHDLEAFLHAASILTETLAQPGSITPVRISTAVLKLLKQVEDSFDTGSERVLPALRALGYQEEADDAPVKEGSLRMVTDQCLGDILIQTGTATAEDVAEGLKAQRATGVRIGEALVMLGKVTWEQVESAVRLQQKLRSTVEKSVGISLTDY